tara:strand:- start:131 stop:613 length:483 start_codon:yes stop_codon:yes gene_type:complete
MSRLNINILVLILISLVLSLISAYAIEFVLGHEPCNLCIYQRIPYIVSIVLILNILFFDKFTKNSLIILSIVSLLGSFLAFYHFGIEQGFFDESIVCKTNDISQSLSKEEILRQLNQKTISCSDVTFRLFGFSLASINTIFSFILFVIFFQLYKKYEINK